MTFTRRSISATCTPNAVCASPANETRSEPRPGGPMRAASTTKRARPEESVTPRPSSSLFSFASTSARPGFTCVVPSSSTSAAASNGDLRRVERHDPRRGIEAQHERLPREIEREIGVRAVDEVRAAPRQVREVTIGDEPRAHAEATAFVGDGLDVWRVRRTYDADSVGGGRSIGAPVARPRCAKTFDHLGVARVALARDVDRHRSRRGAAAPRRRRATPKGSARPDRARHGPRSSRSRERGCVCRRRAQ